MSGRRFGCGAIVARLPPAFGEVGGHALRFMAVGALNLVVTYAIYAGLVLLGCPYNLALALDYVVGVCIGYTLNRWWTFASRAASHRSLPRYVATYVAAYLLNGILLNAVVLSGLAGPLLGQVMALGVTASINFLAQHLWVFRREGKAAGGGVAAQKGPGPC
jgi:putative flippase GtrA